MSRYVRTYNGYRSDIIDLEREVYGRKVVHYNEGELDANSPAGFYWPETEETGFELECGDEDIIKRADTIEELCDEFVGILPSETPYLQFYRRMYTFDDIKKHYFQTLSVEPKVEYYGAIWDNRGLIYVAKMNEKGELELL